MDVVLTIIGPDRPGLVEALSRIVLFHEANWLESRMAHMAGKFAGILRVNVSDQRADALRAALAGLEESGLTVVVEQGATPVVPVERRVLVLDLVGQDRPGIVRHVSSALASRGLNVEELHTSVESAPMSGEMLFRAQVRLTAPEAIDGTELRGALETLASDLMVDIDLAEPQQPP